MCSLPGKNRLSRTRMMPLLKLGSLSKQNFLKPNKGKRIKKFKLNINRNGIKSQASINEHD